MGAWCDGIVVLVIGCIYLLFSIPLSITSMVLSRNNKGCDATDEIGLNVSNYLLTDGIINFIFSLVFVVSILYHSSHGCPPKKFIYLLLFVNFVFSIIWCAIGGTILYRSNLECIKEGSVHVIFAILMWIISIITCCFL